MKHGSLRQVLNTPTMWAQFAPTARHQVLHDIASGMAFLHANNVQHTDLKRQVISCGFGALGAYIALVVTMSNSH
jgi:serine/threonine protein kinase